MRRLPIAPDAPAKKMRMIAQCPPSRRDIVPNGKRLTAGTASAVRSLLDVWHVAAVSVGRHIFGSGDAPAVCAAVIATAVPAVAKSVVAQVSLVRMVILLLGGCG